MTLSPDPRLIAAAAPEAPVPRPEAAEAEMVRSAAAGDGRSFDELVHLHHRRVLHYLCHMVRHRQDAEDLTQQTFLKAFRHLKTFDCSRPLINWLLTIARRTALNHFRDHKKWEEMPVEMASDAPSPARQVEHADHANDLWSRARRLLSAREYEVLWLRFSEEMSTQETARTMGLTQIHVKVLVHRARQQLLKAGIRS